MRVIYVSEKCFCIIAATPFPVAFYAFFLLAIHPELKQCVASALKGFFRPVLSVPCMVPALQRSHKEQAAIRIVSDAIY